MSWNDVRRFIKWLNKLEGTNKYRLPTEAEWEYAARAGTTTPFAFGKCLSTDQANYNGNSPMGGCPTEQYRNRTVPVGSLGSNAWGLYDMHGNVWEWVADHAELQNGKVVNETYTDGIADPVGKKGAGRVIRGGSWDGHARGCRSAFRSAEHPGDGGSGLGFRLARTP